MTAETAPKPDAVHSDPKPNTPPNGQDTKQATNGGPSESRPRLEPTQPLPTDRIHFDNQLKFLQAYASASNQGSKPVTNEDVALAVSMKASTVSLANNFFVKIGFLQRSGREYLPAKEVLDYKLALEWDSPTAAHKLAPIVERSWFGQALKPMLDLRSMEESEAISILAQRATAPKEYRGQLKTLIDYMVVSGMVSREGSMLSLVRRRPNEAPPLESNPERPPASAARPSDEAGATDLSELPFGQVGSIKFSVSINVDMTQMAQWEPQRIAAFFTGLAQVIASQKGGK
jgi:hypothetical protein